MPWQCGIAPGPAREHVRVARRLGELPLIRAAFAEGELSYSKVRALTRVENVEREQDLLDLARHATASQLERLLRAYRGVVAAERAAAGEPPERWITFDHADDGSVLLRGRLPAEEGALVMAALEAARGSARAAGRSRGNARRRDARRSRGDVAAADVDADVPAETRDGCGGVPAGTPRRSPGEARADALVALADAFLAGGADRPPGRAATAIRSSCTPTPRRCRATSRAGGASWRTARRWRSRPSRRLACDASLVQLLERDGQPLRIGRKTRTIPPALRRALNARDRGCRFPGCGSRRFLDAHHIEHWADGGATDLDNLVHLCGHHHRLLHEGGYRIDAHRRRRDPLPPPRRAPDPGLPGPAAQPSGEAAGDAPARRLRAALQRPARPRYWPSTPC